MPEKFARRLQIFLTHLSGRRSNARPGRTTRQYPRTASAKMETACGLPPAARPTNHHSFSDQFDHRGGICRPQTNCWEAAQRPTEATAHPVRHRSPAFDKADEPPFDWTPKRCDSRRATRSEENHRQGRRSAVTLCPASNQSHRGLVAESWHPSALLPPASHQTPASDDFDRIL